MTLNLKSLFILAALAVSCHESAGKTSTRSKVRAEAWEIAAQKGAVPVLVTLNPAAERRAQKKALIDAAPKGSLRRVNLMEYQEQGAPNLYLEASPKGLEYLGQAAEVKSVDVAAQLQLN